MEWEKSDPDSLLAYIFLAAGNVVKAVRPCFRSMKASLKNCSIILFVQGPCSTGTLQVRGPAVVVREPVGIKAPASSERCSAAPQAIRDRLQQGWVSMVDAPAPISPPRRLRAAT